MMVDDTSAGSLRIAERHERARHREVLRADPVEVAEHPLDRALPVLDPFDQI
jgi:hypothetical protein